MKFKYQSKHKLLKSIKRAARHTAGGKWCQSEMNLSRETFPHSLSFSLHFHALGAVLVKSFFYLGTPPICPDHQLSLNYLHPHYIGHFSYGHLCAPCWAPSTLRSTSSSSLSARCASSTISRKWTSCTTYWTPKMPGTRCDASLTWQLIDWWCATVANKIRLQLVARQLEPDTVFRSIVT